MASAYSFLDIAVLDEVRERFAAGEALALLSADLREILWINGAGAEWLGYGDIEAAIGERPGFPAVALRQIAALPGFPDIGRDKPLALRIAGGLKSEVFVLRASAVTMPRGERALLLALPPENGEQDDRAARIVAGFNEPGHFAAVLDDNGQLVAASSDFDGLGLEEEALFSLVRDVRGEEDRLVKKRISGKRSLPAGIARLADDPGTHLLVIVDEAQLNGGAPIEERSASTALAGEEAIGEEVRVSGEEIPAEPVEASQSPDTPEELPVDDSPAESMRPLNSIRFAWRLDAEGRFSAISEEFVEAIGKPAGDVIGRSFPEIADLFSLDPESDITDLLKRRDTWSGRTVMWPVAGSDQKVPVDLAALPVYGRDRNFEGFRGFGIARFAEAETDPDSIGLKLSSRAAEEPADDPSPAPEDAPADELSAQALSEDTVAVTENNTADAEEAFAEETPVDESGDEVIDDKIIRLSEHREVVRETGLSPSERVAFREIGERLRRASEAMAARAEEDQNPGNEEADSAAPESSLSDEQDHRESDAVEEVEEAPPVENEHDEADDRLEPHLEVAPPQSARDVALIAHLPLPVLIHSGDRLHYANAAFSALTGYDDLAELEAAGGIGVLFEGAQDSGVEGGVMRLRNADGDEKPVEAHLHAVPWGGGRALMLALRPVAESNQEQEPAEPDMLLAEMRAIVDTATDGVAVIATDGTIRSVNSPGEALFGFDAEHITGKPFVSLFAIESQRTIADYLASLADNGVASVLNDGRQVIGREAEGRFIPLFITIGRLPNERGYCAVLRDITHWKRVEEQLTQARAEAERASSQKSEFLARVSHEIRTPLNAIIGFSELMIDERFGSIGNERYRDYLRDIQRSGNHVLDLVNDLLDISKIEAGQQEMKYEAVSLNETVGEAVAMMQPQANSDRVIIRSSFASRLPDVVADLRSVRQIALNLLSNAVRYTPAGGQVIVSTAYDREGSVVLRVRDTGVGMSGAELDEALKPFKQINALRRKRGDGTGLGLPLTRAMVEANRARFSIDSTPGEGTLVEIVFPPTRVLAE